MTEDGPDKRKNPRRRDVDNGASSENHPLLPIGSDMIRPPPVAHRDTASTVSSGATEASRETDATPTLDNRAPASRTTKAQRQEFFLPVSGFVWLYPEEVKVTNHPAFQRLGRIYQLGQTYLVYRGATHKRIEHALGCVTVIQRMIDAIGQTSQKRDLQGRQIAAAALSEEEQRFVRLGALLHDIGHVAAGHTLEDELQLIGQHDQDGRLDLVFGPELADRDGRTLAMVIDDAYAPYVPSSLSGISASTIVRLLIRKPPREGSVDRFTAEQSILAASDELRMPVCRDMIGNTICADLLDYLYRDWYHVGKSRPSEDRIYQYMEIRPRSRSLIPSQSSRKRDDSLVISIGQRPKVRTDAISAILDLLEWRYQLAESVLFHRTKLSAASMLDRALWELWEGEDASAIESTVLRLSDEGLLDVCAQRARERADARGMVAAELFENLSVRVLHGHLMTRVYTELPTDLPARLQDTFGSDPQARNRSLRQLEHDFQLPPGSVTMYCPTGKMNAKIAEVKIAVGDEVAVFAEYEKKYDNQLSGGHLDAQLQRFKRLWRVHFFIDRRVRESKAHLLPLIREAIERLVLGDIRDDPDPVRAARQIAVQLSQHIGSPWQGKSVRDAAVLGAFRAPTKGATGGYLFGAPSIAAFFER